ncbi:hypothetical protein TheetDRAFT_0455 [Thermoanaerobacter ethanolicus JW 200]|jgi:hypothetical protein|uniref:Uncharacterized protein n=3 Tax=Thermoanaerobacter TaxID=1754 RepID=I9AES2_9THEO|nr:hypothetical protein Thewi_0619 [Thermoanaerobacter wiegelii Rt8.B1]EGD52795.1 hypothetical protein TheetDRAFT_0455 [Thermoanaerobacter ethanolicus JW 200]EIW00527.1 hypothetical protein ThesiDRAFT1_1608 [Thermoanaerobacter siderophilus SR4]EMT39003.1 hypothetical protein TthWC1_1415 [Thermoanaerobacter thermohydrosulfuricus WC1]
MNFAYIKKRAADLLAADPLINKFRRGVLKCKKYL